MQSVKPKFRSRRYVSALLGRDDADWRSYVGIYAPALRRSDEVLSLGDRYIVSFEAHALLQYLLMDRGGPEPLSVDSCMQSCALLAYATDSPVVPKFGVTKMGVNGESDYSRLFAGVAFDSAREYSESLEALADLCANFTATGFGNCAVHRMLLRDSPAERHWYYYPWPPSERVHRAIGAYWVGTLSVLPSSRILNFWRAIEAVADKDMRTELFVNLEAMGVASVWTGVQQIPITDRPSRVRDSARMLRKLALRRKCALVHEHGTPESALNHVYWEMRGKAAHADKRSLEHDMAAMAGTQLRDAAMLQFLARVAIEEAWAAQQVDADGRPFRGRR